MFLFVFINLMSSCSRKSLTYSGLDSHHHNLCSFFPNFFVQFISVFIIIIMSSCKRGCGGGIPILDMFMISMNRKRSNYQNREKLKPNFQGIPCFIPQQLDELTQLSPKQHSPVIIFIVQTNNLILCHDNICLEHQENIIK